MTEPAGERAADGGDGRGGGRDWALKLVPPVAWALLRLLVLTLRLHHHGDAALRQRERRDRRVIIAFWHRHLLLMPWCYRGRRVTALVSRHRDGEMVARLGERLGIDTTRGSSTRGGVIGMRGLLRKARLGYDLGFAPDGPKGPAGVVKPGVILAARATGWPIQPVAVAASRERRLASWDRFVVPIPFSRVHFVYGEPLTVARDDDAQSAAGELGRRLDAAEREARRLAGLEVGGGFGGGDGSEEQGR